MSHTKPLYFLVSSKYKKFKIKTKSMLQEGFKVNSKEMVTKVKLQWKTVLLTSINLYCCC